MSMKRALVQQKNQMINTRTEHTWEVKAVTILEIRVSINDNRYLLVVQDYF